MISKIDVDRDNTVVRFYVRKLPAVTPELDEILQKERVAADIATAAIGSEGKVLGLLKPVTKKNCRNLP